MPSKWEAIQNQMWAGQWDSLARSIGEKVNRNIMFYHDFIKSISTIKGSIDMTILRVGNGISMVISDLQSRD
jgi:hypothetical protein